jgi:hypothetical protein
MSPADHWRYDELSLRRLQEFATRFLGGGVKVSVAA